MGGQEMEKEENEERKLEELVKRLEEAEEKQLVYARTADDLRGSGGRKLLPLVLRSDRSLPGSPSPRPSRAGFH